MTDLEAIHAAIIREPLEDLHRLVYADALGERANPGDADRAEFIRVQCELWRLDPDRQTGCGLVNSKDKLFGHPLVKREFDLLEKSVWFGMPGSPGVQTTNRSLWSMEVTCTPDVLGHDWIRGFIGKMTMEGDKWVRLGRRTREYFPIEEVELKSLPGIRCGSSNRKGLIYGVNFLAAAGYEDIVVDGFAELRSVEFTMILLNYHFPSIRFEWPDREARRMILRSGLPASTSFGVTSA